MAKKKSKVMAKPKGKPGRPKKIAPPPLPDVFADMAVEIAELKQAQHKLQAAVVAMSHGITELDERINAATYAIDTMMRQIDRLCASTATAAADSAPTARLLQILQERDAMATRLPSALDDEARL